MNAATSVDHTSYYPRLLKDDVRARRSTSSATSLRSAPRSRRAGARAACHPAGDRRRARCAGRLGLRPVPGGRLSRPADRPHHPRHARDSIRAHTVRRSPPLPRHAIIAARRSSSPRPGTSTTPSWSRLAEEHLGRLSRPQAGRAEPGLYRGGERTEARALKEAQILLGFEAPPYIGPTRSTTAQLFSAILGGGMSSRLFQEVRENRGLCYSIYAFHWPFADTGVFGIHAATSEDDVAELVPVVLDELGKMTDGVTAAELAARQGAASRRPADDAGEPVARAGQMARQILVYGRPIPLEEMVATGRRGRRCGDLASSPRACLTSPPTLAAIGPVKELPSVDADRRDGWPGSRAPWAGEQWHSCAPRQPSRRRSSRATGSSCACRALPTIRPGRSSAPRAARSWRRGSRPGRPTI